MDQSAPTTNRLTVWAAGIAAVAIAVFRNVRTVADHDLWGHLRFGLDKIDAGGYIEADYYSYLTTGNTWFNHEWGGEVIMAALYRFGGPGALVLAKAIVLIAVVVALFRFLHRRGLAPIPAIALLAVSALLLAPTFGTFRPQIFTVGLLTALLMLLDRIDRGQFCLAPFLAPLVAVWVNVHGGALAGVGVIGLWMLLRTRKPEGRLVIVWSGVAAVGAFLLAHPLGPRHAWFLFTSTLERRPEILDWQPVEFGEAVGIVYGLTALATLLVVWRRRGMLNWPMAAPLVVLVLAPLSASRHLQLAAVAIVVLGALAFEQDGVATATWRDAASVGIIAAVVAVAAGVQTLRAVDCLELDPGQFETPVASVAALGGLVEEGNVIVPFNWGEYVIWELGPAVQVSVDGRRETVYSASVLDENLAFERGSNGWDRILSRGEPVAALLPSGSPTARFLLDRGWLWTHNDDTANVLIRPELETRRPGPNAPHDGAGMCFPDAEPQR